RKVEIDARAEANETYPLAYADAVALLHEGDDAPRDQAGDLHDRDFAVRARVDDDAAPLVLLARLVRGGVEEAARHVDRADDAARRRRAIDVHIEDRQEDGDAQARGLAEPEFHGRAHALDGTNAPVGRRDDQTLAQRRDARGIAEEICYPEGGEHREPGQRRPQQEQEQCDAGADGDELDAVAMDGHDGLANGVQQAMTLSHATSPGARRSSA